MASIAKWSIGQSVVFLVQEPGQLKVMRDGRSYTFTPKLYSMQYAVNLIHLFHETIACNLSEQKVHSSCFLPQFCLGAHEAPEYRVALFGHMDTQRSPTGILKGLKWGVYHTPTQTEEILEIPEDDSAVREFIAFAPTTSDQMLSCLNQCRVKLTHDPQTKRITDIALERFSLIDPNVLLSEQRYAVTLLSKQQEGWFARLFDPGHAMIAYEGVNHGQCFLGYIHLTQKQQQAKDEKGTIEIFTRKTLLSPAANGPTWSVPKDLVDRMFSHIENLKNNPNVTHDANQADAHIPFRLLAPLSGLSDEAFVERERGRHLGMGYENCLSFAVCTLRAGRINLYEPRDPRPTRYVSRLAKDFIFRVDPRDGSIDTFSRDEQEDMRHTDDMGVRFVADLQAILAQYQQEIGAQAIPK